MRLLSIALLLVACHQPAAAPVADAASVEPAPARQAKAVSNSRCEMAGRGEWSAHVNAMPGPGSRPKLIVTGRIGVKPAAVTTLRLDPAVMESDPPQYSVILDIRLPREPTIDMLERREVRGEWPVGTRVGAVHIRCGGRAVATVSDVETAY
jgi:hypothetical protein